MKVVPHRVTEWETPFGKVPRDNRQLHLKSTSPTVFKKKYKVAYHRLGGGKDYSPNALLRRSATLRSLYRLRRTLSVGICGIGQRVLRKKITDSSGFLGFHFTSFARVELFHTRPSENNRALAPHKHGAPSCTV